ncbi:MAG TPA: DUF5107 domain-containing protein [Anaerolineae bacterium]|nr:DUF5107 domain-containing protein [Anaerolineae bacterium]HQH37364.1 DUF5107 domain-containing protein [Anaerolineae bacterium]
MRQKQHVMCLALLTILAVSGIPHRTLAQSTQVGNRSHNALRTRSNALNAAIFYTTTITIPTYPYADYLYDAYNATYNMTYPVLDWGRYNAANPTPVPRDYELLVMANDYLTVTVLPELGGRVYQLLDKASGQNHLYQNPVIKPTGWGPPEQGWWLAAGGIEWCLPVDEHGYESGLPWDWTAIISSAGVTITVSDSDATDRLRARIDLFLPAQRAYLLVAPHIENPTGAAVDYKFWINAALAPGATNKPTAGVEFICHAAAMAVHSTGDTRLPGAGLFPTTPDYRFTWPVYNGVDYSRLGNWHEWLGFFEYPQAAGDFIGVYNHDTQAGVARVFPRDIARGTKGFAYGWANPLDWHGWTDVDSGGVELHGGVALTFWDTAHLEAGATLSWAEVWYPVNATGGVTAATREAALHLHKTDDALAIALHTTTWRTAGSGRLIVWEQDTCREWLNQPLPALTPSAPYATSAWVGTLLLDQLAVAYVDEQGNVLVASGPTTCLHTKPRLALETTQRVLLAEIGAPQVMTTSVRIDNVGYGALTWTAELAPGGTLTPTLPVPSGVQGEPLWIVVDTTGYVTGTYTRAITVTASPSVTLDSPQSLTVTLRIVPELARVYLPGVLRNYAPPQSIILPTGDTGR